MIKKAGQVIITIFVLFTLFVIGSKVVKDNISTTEINVSNQTEVQVKHHLKVFYFHGNVRCPSCKKIEAYTKETLNDGFKAEINAGLIEFQMLNVDKPENEKYIEKYELTTKQVIVAEFENGVEKRWKDLDRIWELLETKEDFIAYEKMEISAWLAEVKK
jgi:hypothetical protein